MRRYQVLTANHPKIIGINLFKIIETLHQNKENSLYLNDLCQMVCRDYNDVKVDVMYLSSLGYAQSDFIEESVNQRVAFLTPRSVMVMDRTAPPRDYDEFIQTFAHPEKDFGDPAISENEGKFKRAFGFLKSN